MAVSLDKPIRNMDSILVRVPDGVKDRLTQRASANGRSMNAELVAIITEALGVPDELEMRELETRREMLLREEETARAQFEAVQSRLMAVNAEIMIRRDSIRKAKHDERLANVIMPEDRAE